jgi:hypothetical protein
LIEAGIVTEEKAREIIDVHLADASPNYEAQVNQGCGKGNDTALKEFSARRAFVATAAQQQAALRRCSHRSPNHHRMSHTEGWRNCVQIAQGFARNMAAYNYGLRCPENVAQDMRYAITELDPGTVACIDMGLLRSARCAGGGDRQRAGLSLRWQQSQNTST